MDEFELKKFLGARVKELRIKKGLTQEQLAELIGVGERNLSKLECGEIFIKAPTISKLISALNIDIKELFDFSLKKSKSEIKNILKQAIDKDLVDVELLYRIYRSIKY